MRPSYSRIGERFVPIWTGGEHDEHQRWVTDLSGDNIHDQRLEELRQQYFVWKNGLVDGLYVGFEHYRRCFMLNPLGGLETSERFPKFFAAQRGMESDTMLWRAEVGADVFMEYMELRRSLDERHLAKLEAWITSFDIIAQRPYNHEDIEAQWLAHLPAEHWMSFQKAVARHPYFRDRLDLVNFHHRGIHFCNMYIMRPDLFEEYMPLMYDIMHSLTEHINPAERTRGLLAERLFSVWLLFKRLEDPSLRITTVPHMLCVDPENLPTLPQGVVAPV